MQPVCFSLDKEKLVLEKDVLPRQCLVLHSLGPFACRSPRRNAASGPPPPFISQDDPKRVRACSRMSGFFSLRAREKYQAYGAKCQRLLAGQPRQFQGVERGIASLVVVKIDEDLPRSLRQPPAATPQPAAQLRAGVATGVGLRSRSMQA